MFLLVHRLVHNVLFGEARLQLIINDHLGLDEDLLALRNDCVVLVDARLCIAEENVNDIICHGMRMRRVFLHFLDMLCLRLLLSQLLLR